MTHIEIPGTSYVFDDSRLDSLEDLSQRVQEMRTQGKLSPDVLHRIRKHFRIKNIYHSNAIEGNELAVGETRLVVEQGLTITGKPLKDQAEARNLSHALDFLEELVSNVEMPITEKDVRQIHSLVLQGLTGEAGSYRTVDVSISGSQFSPPGAESVPILMRDFGNWLSEISVPSAESFAEATGLLAAAVAHTWFVSIHPFIDGNGRVARLLLNLVLMRFGFPIAIVTKEDRLRYYDALESSQSSELTPFVMLISECIEESLEEYEAAAREQREQAEWAASLAQKFTRPERIRAENEYEVWKNAMELLKSVVQHTVDVFNQESMTFGNVYFKDFGNLNFEKFSALRQGVSAKRTWFFRVDFRRGETTARYLFFFGHASSQMRSHCDVTIHVAREEPSNSYNYQRLELIGATNVPDLAEIGYKMSEECFVVRSRNQSRANTRLVEKFTQQFFEEVVQKHFST